MCARIVVRIYVRENAMSAHANIHVRAYAMHCHASECMSKKVSKQGATPAILQKAQAATLCEQCREGWEKRRQDEEEED